MAQSADRSLVSTADRRRPLVRWSLLSGQSLLLVVLLVWGLAPLLWLGKASLSTTQDILLNPLALLPKGGWHTTSLSAAWNDDRIGVYVWHSLVLAAGCVISNLLVCTTVAYVLAVLRPAWGPVLSGAILATLFIPPVVILVPLYLTVLHLPLVGINLQNTYWAIWLTAAANPFNVVVVRRFMSQIPQDLFEAARVDGAGPWRVLLLIVIPLSRPILAVVALFSAIASWKDFLWPLLVVPDPNHQPVSVAIYKLATNNADLSTLMASLFIATILPVAVFLLFQRQFLSGVALSGSIKE